MSTTTEALRLAREALQYHTEQTRPIERTKQAIAAIDAALAQQPSAPSAEPPTAAIGLLLNAAMDQAVSNGANSVSMPDEIVAVAAWLARVAPTAPAPQPADDVTPERAELVAAWNDLPDSLRCHPGMKRLFRACQAIPSAATPPPAEPAAPMAAAREPLTDAEIVEKTGAVGGPMKAYATGVWRLAEHYITGNWADTTTKE